MKWLCMQLIALGAVVAQSGQATPVGNAEAVERRLVGTPRLSTSWLNATAPSCATGHRSIPAHGSMGARRRNVD